MYPPPPPPPKMAHLSFWLPPKKRQALGVPQRNGTPKRSREFEAVQRRRVRLISSEFLKLAALSSLRSSDGHEPSLAFGQVVLLNMMARSRLIDTSVYLGITELSFGKGVLGLQLCPCLPCKHRAH